MFGKLSIKEIKKVVNEFAENKFVMATVDDCQELVPIGIILDWPWPTTPEQSCCSCFVKVDFVVDRQELISKWELEAKLNEAYLALQKKLFANMAYAAHKLGVTGDNWTQFGKEADEYMDNLIRTQIKASNCTMGDWKGE